MLKSLIRFGAFGVLAAGLAASAAWAEKVAKEKLSEFMSVMPAAPAGYTRGDNIGAYSSDSMSSATASYQGADGARFTISVTFGKDLLKEQADLIKSKNEAQLKKFGVDVVKIKDRDGLVRKPDNKNKYTAIYTVVAGSRVVSLMESGGVPDPAAMKAAFEAIDFDAVAKK